MPTANANTGNGFSKAISYALQEKKALPEKDRAVIFEQNNIFGTSRQMGQQMRFMSDVRDRVSKPVLHLQINFHPDEKLNKVQAQKVVDSILKDIGIEKESHQYLVVQHQDKEHDHYHVIANRVGLDGSLVDGSYLKNRLQVACDKAEKEQNLRLTQGRTVMYDTSTEKGFRYATPEEKSLQRQQKENKLIIDKNPKMMAEKNAIRDYLSAALAEMKVNTPKKLQAELKKKGIEIQFTSNKNGISGASFRKDNIAVKGSAIGYKWNDINKVLEENKVKVQELSISNRVQIKSMLAAYREKEQEKSLVVKDKPAKADLPVPKFEKKPDPSSTTGQLNKTIKETIKRLKEEQAATSNTISPAPKETVQRLKEEKAVPPATINQPKETPKEGLQPTEEEREEHEFIKDYNPRIERAVDEIIAELQNGNAGVAIAAIMKKNGFRSEKDRFVYSNGIRQIGIDKSRFERPVSEVKRQEAYFKEEEKKYKELMRQEPVAITFWDKLIGRAKGKEEANRTLQREKRDAIKPEFKPSIYGIERRDFKLFSKFENREYEYNRLAKIREMFAPAREQEDKSRGLGR